MPRNCRLGKCCDSGVSSNLHFHYSTSSRVSPGTVFRTARLRANTTVHKGAIPSLIVQGHCVGANLWWIGPSGTSRMAVPSSFVVNVFRRAVMAVFVTEKQYPSPSPSPGQHHWHEKSTMQEVQSVLECPNDIINRLCGSGVFDGN